MLRVTQTQATIQRVTSGYLSVTTADLSLTYVRDGVEESLLRRAHFKFALRSRDDESCTENLCDHGNETQSATEIQKPVELANPCLTYNTYCKISDTIRLVGFLSLSGLYVTKNPKIKGTVI